MSEFRLLVVGPGRGGTSLLAALLDSHPDLTVAFERFAKATLMGQAAEAPALASERTELFLRQCGAEAARAPTRWWGNKVTTEQLAGLQPRPEGADFPVRLGETVEAFFSRLLGHVHVVFLLRDGRTCVRSKMRRANLSLEAASRRWRYAVSVWRLLHSRPGVSVVRYEDLLAQPEQSLRTLCERIAVSYAPEMLRGTDHPRMAEAYRNPGFVVEKAGLSDLPEGWEAFLSDDLRETGYLASDPA